MSITKRLKAIASFIPKACSSTYKFTEQDLVVPAIVIRYRKKPVEVSAVLFDGTLQSVQSFIPSDILEYKELDKVNSTLIPPTILISTLEGQMIAQVGDYIIEGVRGEFYPCKPHIFKETYEEI